MVNHFIFAEKRSKKVRRWKFSLCVLFRTGGDKQWCWKDLSKASVFPADGAALVAMSEGCVQDWQLLVSVPAILQHFVRCNLRCKVYWGKGIQRTLEIPTVQNGSGLFTQVHRCCTIWISPCGVSLCLCYSLVHLHYWLCIVFPQGLHNLYKYTAYIWG